MAGCLDSRQSGGLPGTFSALSGTVYASWVVVSEVAAAFGSSFHPGVAPANAAAAEVANAAAC